MDKTIWDKIKSTETLEKQALIRLVSELFLIVTRSFLSFAAPLMIMGLWSVFEYSTERRT